MLEQLMNGLCEYLNIEPLQPEDGVYEIVFDDGMPVEILALSGTQILIRSQLLVLPENQDEWEPILSRCLNDNLLVLREQSSTMSLDAEAGVLWLYRTTHARRTTVQQFCEALSEFTVTQEWWSQRNDASGRDGSGPMGAVMPQMFLRP